MSNTPYIDSGELITLPPKDQLKQWRIDRSIHKNSCSAAHASISSHIKLMSALRDPSTKEWVNKNICNKEVACLVFRK